MGCRGDFFSCGLLVDMAHLYPVLTAPERPAKVHRSAGLQADKFFHRVIERVFRV